MPIFFLPLGNDPHQFVRKRALQGLLDAGIGWPDDIELGRETSQGFGRFGRSLVGLDRTAVNEAFGEFLAAGTASAAQIEFITTIIEHLTDQGSMDEGLLYEPPFVDIAPMGPGSVFGNEPTARIIKTIRHINESAVA